MKLSDLIIEHGPYGDGDMVVHGFDDAERLNELREELIAARRITTAFERCAVEIDHWNDEAVIGCGCGATSSIGEETPLPELIRWASEHAEVCG